MWFILKHNNPIINNRGSITLDVATPIVFLILEIYMICGFTKASHQKFHIVCFYQIVYLTARIKYSGPKRSLAVLQFGDELNGI